MLRRALLPLLAAMAVAGVVGIGIAVFLAAVLGYLP